MTVQQDQRALNTEIAQVKHIAAVVLAGIVLAAGAAAAGVAAAGIEVAGIEVVIRSVSFMRPRLRVRRLGRASANAKAQPQSGFLGTRRARNQREMSVLDSQDTTPLLRAAAGRTE